MPTTDWIKKWAYYFPGKIALKEYETGRALTYGELNRLADATVAILQKEYDISPGDRIAILAENCLEYFVLFSAAQKSGIILVPLNYRLTSEELKFMLEDSEPTLLVVEKKYEQKVNFLSIPILSIKEFFRHISKKSGNDTGENNASPVKFEDPLFILYTSGTTGTPKGAIYTHGMLFWNSINTSLRLDITSDDRSISCTPMFHTGGWNVIPTPFLHRGATVTITRKFEPDVVLQLLEQEKATMFMAVPTMLQMMADSPKFQEVNLSSMRFFIIGGEPMPLPLIDIWHGKGIPIRQGYGLTEAGPSITSLHQDDAIRKRGTIGTPNFYLDIKIVNEEGKEVAPGEIGELLLKGPVVTPGYWKNPKATESAFTDGWFHTGDMVVQDEEGYLTIMDRKKNMYISGGENVYPAEVEKVILKHPDVKEVAIIGVPDEKWGEVGKAFVVRKKNSALEEDDLIRYLQDKVAKYKLPKRITFIEEIPKTDTGKIDRKALK
ncbi:MAG: long-chain fatty acid--CoA ligase [Calditrichia bacterium]